MIKQIKTSKALLVLVVLSSVFFAYTLVAQNPPYAPVGGDLTTMSQGEGLVVFTSNRGPNWDIWMTRSDGAFPIQLTDDDAIEWDIDVSLDGRRIAYTADLAPIPGGFDEIVVMNIDGSESTIILTGGPGWIVWAPKWMPDNHRIVFRNVFDGFLYLIDANNPGGIPRRLEPSSASLEDSPATGSGTMLTIDPRSDEWRTILNLVIDDRNHAWVHIPDEPQACFQDGRCGLDEFPLLVRLAKYPNCNAELRSSPTYISPQFFQNNDPENCSQELDEASFIEFSTGDTERRDNSGMYHPIVVPVPCYESAECR